MFVDVTASVEFVLRSLIMLAFEIIVCRFNSDITTLEKEQLLYYLDMSTLFNTVFS